jgi:hypothetical protein
MEYSYSLEIIVAPEGLTFAIIIYSGKEQDVTLYGKLGNDFYAEIRKKCRQGPVIAVFAGMTVCHYKSKFLIYPFINLFSSFYHVIPYIKQL